MKIYPAEIECGIQLAKASSTISALIVQPSDQPDLYPIKSILCSTGWNKNDDIFDKNETLKAYKSIINKKINFEHNENDIIGHITNSYIVDDDYNPMEIDCDIDCPDFNVLTDGLLYTYWEDETSKARIDKIINEMADGKWFVSMECIFKEFDYAISKGGQDYIIQRNENTAFLTKCLRIYGGTGEYEGYKVGRLFKNFTFSGKAIVKNPANDKSVIISKASFKPIEIKETFDFSKSSVFIDKETGMDLQAELDKVKEELKNTQEKLQAKASEEITQKETKIKELEVSLASLACEKETASEKLAQAEQLVLDLKTKLEEAEAAKKKMMDEQMDMAKKAKCTERKAKAMQVGVTEEDAAKAAEKFIDVSDEIWEEYVNALAFKFSKPTETETVEVEATETVVITEETDSNNLIESVAEWFIKNKNKGEK